MVLLSLVVVVAYVLITAAIMYFNLAVLKLGDPKYVGGGPFELYWPLWMGLYTPLVIASLAAIGMADIRGPASFKIAGLLLVLIVVLLEVSFVFDVAWYTVLIEWVVGSAALFWLVRAWSAE